MHSNWSFSLFFVIYIYKIDRLETKFILRYYNCNPLVFGRAVSNCFTSVLNLRIATWILIYKDSFRRNNKKMVTIY